MVWESERKRRGEALYPVSLAHLSRCSHAEGNKEQGEAGRCPRRPGLAITAYANYPGCVLRGPAREQSKRHRIPSRPITCLLLQKSCQLNNFC